MKRFLLFIFSFIILSAILIFVNPYETFKEMSKVKIEVILITFIIANLATFIRVLKWRFLLDNVKMKDLIPIQLLGITISNLTPGKSGEPIKSILLKLKTGKSISSTLPSVIWERILDILVLLLFSFIGIYTFIDRFSEEYKFFIYFSIFAFIIIITFLFLGLKNKFLGKVILKYLKKLSFFKSVNEKFLENFYSSTKIKYYNILASFILTAFVWLLDSLIFFLISTSFISNTKINIITFSSLLSISILLSILSFLPGGIGGTEAIMILLLVYLGFSKSIAASIVIIGRFMTLGYSFILGYLSFLYLSRNKNIGLIRNFFK